MHLWGDDDPSCDFYDSDTPVDGPNLDASARRIGLADDIAHYRKVAAEASNPILVLCCGTGRIALPLLADGHTVTAVDASPCMLRQFRAKLGDLGDRLTLIQADITELQFREAFGLVILPFNSISAVPTFAAQLQVFQNAFNALMPGGVFGVDLPNALLAPRSASLRPLLMYTRQHITRGTRYSRFSFNGPLEADQRQRLFGYYDEIRADGTLVRREWEKELRHIFRFELELMLRMCGFEDVEMWGNFARGAFKATDEKMVVQARRSRP